MAGIVVRGSDSRNEFATKSVTMDIGFKSIRIGSGLTHVGLNEGVIQMEKINGDRIVCGEKNSVLYVDEHGMLNIINSNGKKIKVWEQSLANFIIFKNDDQIDNIVIKDRKYLVKGWNEIYAQGFYMENNLFIYDNIIKRPVSIDFCGSLSGLTSSVYCFYIVKNPDIDQIERSIGNKKRNVVVNKSLIVPLFDVKADGSRYVTFNGSIIIKLKKGDKFGIFIINETDNTPAMIRNASVKLVSH